MEGGLASSFFLSLSLGAWSWTKVWGLHPGEKTQQTFSIRKHSHLARYSGCAGGYRADAVLLFSSGLGECSWDSPFLNLQR